MRLILFLVCLLACLQVAVPSHGDGIPHEDHVPHPSIHARQLQYWDRQAPRDWKSIGPRVPKAWPRRQRTTTQTHHILGFHPYWMGTNYLAYDWSTLHTLVFFSLEVDATGGISEAHGWPWTQLVQHAHDNGGRVLVAATQFSSNDLSTLLGSATYRSAAVANLVNAMVQGDADGLCLDFEAIPGSRKQEYVAFADELRAAMQVTLPQSMLVITTPAVDWNNAYDYDELAARSDYLLLMAYDYHWSGSATSGPVAPLTGWGTYNVSWSIQDHLTWGAPADKLLLGVPYYGYRWETTSGIAGAATTSSGVALTYGNVQPQIPLQEELWDVPSQTPWLRTQNPDWQQTWYDDAVSLGAKYATVISEDLAGVGIWALGYDDPYTALWNALHDAFDQNTSGTPESPTPRAPALLVRSANPFRHRVQLVVQLATGQQSVESRIANTSAPCNALVRLFDARGRLVRTLQPTSCTDGRLQYRWDAHDATGAEVAPGVYLATFGDGRRPEDMDQAVRLIRLR